MMNNERPGGCDAKARLKRASAAAGIVFVAVSVLWATGVGMSGAPRDRGVDDAGLLGKDLIFEGIWHNVGQLLLHVSNLGYFGRFAWDADNPSGEWPAGSDDEYLYAAGLWIGGVRASDDSTVCTAAVYQLEFRPYIDFPGLSVPRNELVIYETFEGAARGERLIDDDQDGQIDEDPLNGRDDDGDGLDDEDFAAVSQQMFRCEYTDIDTSVNINRATDFHSPIGLLVAQESYAWTADAVDDFIGIEYRVVMMSQDTLRDAYVGFMVDADAGEDDLINPYYDDDLAGFADTVLPDPDFPEDTLHITVGFMYDAPGGGDDVNGYFGVMFLGHTTDTAGVAAPREVAIHSYRNWSKGDEDPDNDLQRYYYLTGRDKQGNPAPLIDGPTGRPSDWRFMVSAGPFLEIRPDEEFTFQAAFVAGEGKTGMLQNAIQAQRVYNGRDQIIVRPGGILDTVRVNWVTDSPPPPPNVRVTPGDGFVLIQWDDFPESVPDPLTRKLDFYGYEIWKASGWRRDSTIPRDDMWALLKRIPRPDLYLYDTGLEGIGKYKYTDYDVHNGFPYWYAVTAYDRVIDARGNIVNHFGKYSQSDTLVYPASAARASFSTIRVVPNPYRLTASWNLEPTERDYSGERIQFQNLPLGSIVRIYTLAGELVQTLHQNPDEGGAVEWNLISRNNQYVVSGVYIYHVDSPAGDYVGRFLVVK
jgi:hypothetical protein